MSGRVFNSRTAPAPLGVSDDWIERRDDEMRAQEEAPVSIVRNSPMYQAQLNLVKHLQRQLAEANERIKQLESGAPTKVKKPRKYDNGKPGPARAAAVVTVEGVRWFSLRHVAETRGLNQSNVSRKLQKADGIPVKIIGGVKYIPMSHAENFKNEAKTKKRTSR